jgi:DNA-binding PadR family transcriptional regulator
MNNMTKNTPQGALTEAVYYILLSMLKPTHGYAVMQNIDKMTHGRVTLGAGTLYGAINTLLEKQWIRAITGDKDSRKKEYITTDIGQKILQQELIRLEELLNNGKNKLENNP